jgi:hypothetical protein
MTGHTRNPAKMTKGTSKPGRSKLVVKPISLADLCENDGPSLGALRPRLKKPVNEAYLKGQAVANTAAASASADPLPSGWVAMQASGSGRCTCTRRVWLPLAIDSALGSCPLADRAGRGGRRVLLLLRHGRGSVGAADGSCSAQDGRSH